MQPEFFSLPMLLWGTTSLPGALFLSRVHVIVLWFYAGLHKFLSPDLLEATASRFAELRPLDGALHLLPFVALLPALEIAMALMAIMPRTRWAAAYLAIPVHLTILAALAMAQPEAARNIAVWPWNLALACAGVALFLPWKRAVAADFLVQRHVVQGAALILAISPLGFYLGLVDAYPAHQLYSAGIAKATISCPGVCDASRDINATWFDLHVPLPPQPRLYRELFARNCQAGDVLKIVDPHPSFWSQDASGVPISCPTQALPAAHP